MKKVVFALLLAVCGVLTANDIPMIKTAFVSGRVEIKETGSVVEVAETDLKLKEQSASAKIACGDKTFLWKPSELVSRATGGADIISTHLTADGSCTVICERTGGAGNPNGLRIVCVDNDSGKVIRATGVFEINLLQAVLLNDTQLVFTASRPADSSGNFFAGAIDIVSEEITRKSADISGEPKAIACASGLLYVAEQQKKTISVYDAESFELLAVCSCGFAPEGVVLSADKSALAVFGNGVLDIYDAQVHNKTLYRKKHFSCPGANFTRCVIADPAAELVTVFSPGENGWTTLGDKLVKLDIICGEYAAAYVPERVILIENRMRALEMFRLPDIAVKKKYEPRKMRPASRNDNTFFAFVPGKKSSALILADHRGNLWKILLTGKRGKKLPVLMVDDTGIRK